ncbi:MAG: cation:proton antiporter [Myxococcota bacterium]
MLSKQWSKFLAVCLSVFVVWGWPLAADAAGGGSGALDETESRLLLLLAIIGVAYLVTHLVLERVAERYGFVTGIEYVVLGAILSPVLGLIETADINAMTPAIVLGTGSLGLLTGLHIDLSEFRKPMPRRALKVALTVSLLTAIFVMLLPAFAIYYFHSPELMLSLAPGLLCVGTVALVADAGPIRAMISYLGAEGPGTDLGIKTAHLCASIGVILFGLIFCVYNPTDLPFVPSGPSGPFVWFGVHLLLGSVLGLIFSWLLRRDFGDEKILTVVIGMVIFASGMAYYLQLSPIFVNFVLGVVLMNMGRHSGHVESRLMSIRRPLYILLFFFAGAGWVLDAPWWTYALVVPYLLLRWFGRIVGGLLSRSVASTEARNAGISRALMAPGALSVAMLLDFDQVYEQLYYEPIIYNGLLLAIVISEIASYKLTRTWLIDATDVAPPEQRGTSSFPSDEVTSR